jgi:methyltransferase (TIGR00027 family)
MQKVAMPGFYLHFALRKRCIEGFVKAAIHDGAEQLIVIGAGFDTLSLRIAKEYPNLSIIEIDHPATQTLKSDAIDRLDQQLKNLHLLSLDLTQDNMQDMLLKSEHYDENKSSAFVAEGLLMYLTEKHVREMLNFMSVNSGHGSQFIFTYMEENETGNYQFKNSSWVATFWLWMKKKNSHGD